MRKTYFKPLVEVQPVCIKDILQTLSASKDFHTDESLSIAFEDADWEDEEVVWTRSHWHALWDGW